MAATPAATTTSIATIIHSKYQQEQFQRKRNK